jgi:DeoR/GlpR family transcriptional regulator of sugar metabolism
MQAEERQKRIEGYLLKTEFASLDELSEQVDASVSTVRRDLDILESAGVVRRTHGGARLVNPKSDEFTFSARDAHQFEEKEAIGRACAELIQPNQTVILDAGTTVYHVAKHLESKSPQIITNSLPVANLFSGMGKVEVLVSGGVIYPRLNVLVGPLAVELFSKIRADVAILSAGGISLEGISNSHGLLIDIQRSMIHAARQVIFCLDHTKFGRQSLSNLCGLEMIDTIVTDRGVPSDLVRALQKKSIKVIVANHV